MLLQNYDLHDIHSVLTLMRFKPTAPYNLEIIQAILEALTEAQTNNIVENNIIRKKLRQIEAIDKEAFYWIYVDNAYTYGVKIIDSIPCYTILTNGFKMMLECANNGEYKRLEDLADALHNIPIFFAEGGKGLKAFVRVEFSYYNKAYKTNLLKKLFKH